MQKEARHREMAQVITVYPATTRIVPLQTSLIPSPLDGISEAESYSTATFVLTAHGQPLDDCDTVRAKAFCPNCGEFQNELRRRCYRPDCPLCYRSWLSRASREATERLLQGKRLTGTVLHHVVFSLPPGMTSNDEVDLQRLRNRLYYRLKKAGARGALVIFHPYRFRSTTTGVMVAWKHCSLNPEAESPVVQCYAEWSPHFHLIVSGYLMNSREFHDKFGWVYKKLHYKKPLRKEGEIRNTIWYCLSHTGHIKGKQAYTYWGDFSNSNMLIGKEHYEFSEVVCPECGTQLLIEYMKPVEVGGTLQKFCEPLYRKEVHRTYVLRRNET